MTSLHYSKTDLAIIRYKNWLVIKVASPRAIAGLRHSDRDLLKAKSEMLNLRALLKCADEERNILKLAAWDFALNGEVQGYHRDIVA